MINTKKGNIAVAIAIVIAGLVVAGAVIFTNGLGDDDKNPIANGDNEFDPSNVAEVTEEDWVTGNRDAQIKIVEYSDTECPFCALLHPTIKQVQENYDGQVAWVYRHFPIPQLHPIAPTVSHASECVGELGGNDAFWNYINKIYQLSYDNLQLPQEERASLSEHAQNPELLTTYAVEFGVDEDAFTQCMEETRHQEKITNDYQNAISAGGQGTPFNVIVLDDEMSAEQKTAVEEIASQVNRPGQDPNIVISESDRHISLAGAMPLEVWTGIVDAILK